MIEKNKMKILPMCKLRDNNNKGFTLLEILVAIVLLSIGLLAMGSLTVGIMGGNLFSNRLTVATILAQDKMEDNRRLGFNGTLAPADPDEDEGYNEIENYPLYRRVTSAAVITDGSPPVEVADIKTITVTVYWDSDKHWVALKTILAE